MRPLKVGVLPCGLASSARDTTTEGNNDEDDSDEESKTLRVIATKTWSPLEGLRVRESRSKLVCLIW